MRLHMHCDVADVVHLSRENHRADHLRVQEGAEIQNWGGTCNNMLRSWRSGCCSGKASMQPIKQVACCSPALNDSPDVVGVLRVHIERDIAASLLEAPQQGAVHLNVEAN